MKWLVWGVSILAYVFSIINRSSFSALGATAQTHFGVEATTISLFIILQLVVYASCQIPVGTFLDQKGAPLVVTMGLVLMTCGQALLAVSETVPLALLARVLVGSGDACMFVSLIRLISEWFTPKQIPVVNQISANLGQMGQLIAVTPLVMLISSLGWRNGFLALSALGICLTFLAVLTLKQKPTAPTLLQGLGVSRKHTTHTEKIVDDTARAEHPYPVTDSIPVLPSKRRISGSSWAALKAVLVFPGVRLAFWIHFATASMIFSIMLLWGMPFMTGGLGYSKSQASMVLSTVVLAIIIAGFFTGSVLARFAPYRVHIAWVSCLVNLSLWSAVFFWPVPAPLALTTLAAITLGANGPISMVAFEVVRSHVKPSQRGVATGIANMGGFVGALITVLLIGLVLDASGAGRPENYSLEAFRWAMASHIPITVLGLVMILCLYPQAKKQLKGNY